MSLFDQYECYLAECEEQDLYSLGFDEWANDETPEIETYYF